MILEVSKPELVVYCIVPVVEVVVVLTVELVDVLKVESDVVVVALTETRSVAEVADCCGTVESVTVTQ